MIATSRPRCPTPCRRASAPTTAGATAPSAQPSRRGLWPIAPPMPPLAPVTRTRQRWSCMNRWYPWRGSGRPTALGRLRVLAVVPSSTEPSWRRSGRHGREPCPLSRAHCKTGNAESFRSANPPPGRGRGGDRRSHQSHARASSTLDRTLAPASGNWPRRRTGARCRCTVRERIRAADRAEQVLLSYPARSSLPTRLGPPSAAGPRGGRRRCVAEPTGQRRRAREDAGTRR